MKIAKMQKHPHQMIKHQMNLLKLVAVVEFEVKVVPAGSGAMPGVFAAGMPIFLAHELPPFATLTDAKGVDLTLIDDADNKPGTTLRATTCVNRDEEHTRNEQFFIRAEPPLTLTMPMNDVNYKLAITTEHANLVSTCALPPCASRPASPNLSCHPRFCPSIPHWFRSRSRLDSILDCLSPKCRTTRT